MRDLVYVILLLIVAGAIAYGFDALCVNMLPQNVSNVLVKPFALGIRPLSFHLSICGTIGIILAYMLMKFIFRK